MSAYQRLHDKIVKSTDPKGHAIPAERNKLGEYQLKAGVRFDKEYIEFQMAVGTVSIGSFESYGLSMPENYYLSVVNRLRWLRDITQGQFPANLVPLYQSNEHEDMCWDCVKGKPVAYDYLTMTMMPVFGNLITLFDSAVSSAMAGH